MRRLLFSPLRLSLAVALCAGTLPAGALSDKEALDAVRSFVAAWNSRDPGAFAATLHYPHVRPAGGGGERVYATPEEYAAEIDFARVTATGWDHSAYDSLRVVHLGRDKAHVAGTYTRYRADGSKIWSNQVTYVVTQDENGGIGVQARFAAGFELDDAEARAQSEKAALAVVREYMRAFNARDEVAWAATFNYPHVRVASGTVNVWEDAKAYTDAFDFDAFARRFGWDHSGWDSLEAIQVAADGVNVALDFSRYNAAGEKISTFHTLYLVTRQDGHWGVRARSSFAP